jgi:hypothetical protein
LKAIFLVFACLVLVVGLSAIVPLAGEARGRSAASSAAMDDDYVVALGTANRFLHAWQTQDQETGLLMLADTLKQHTSEDHLQALFSTAGSVQGYEISHGKKLGAGRYSFPVAVFEAPGGNKKRTRPRCSSIVVARTGKNDWTIDKLP